MLKTIEWINNEIVANNLICDEIDKIRAAKSKKQLFEVCCGAKGIDFLPMMRSKGHPLSYDVINEEFGRYINGKHKPDFGYTSAIYCKHNENIHIDTTVVCLLSCDCELIVAENNVTQIVVDQNSKIRIFCPKSSKVIVEYFCDIDDIEIIDGCKNIRFVNGNK